MAYMTTAKAQTLISDLIDEVWDAEDPNALNEHEKYMNVSNLTRAEEVNYEVGGFPMPEERAVMEDIVYHEPIFGQKQTITPINWGAGFRVAQETIKDLADAGPFDGVNAARLAEYGNYTKKLKKKCNERVDLECALKLVNGTSTAARYIGRDGLALFSASHQTLGNPPLTQSNLSTGAAMTATNVMSAITAIKTQRDNTGGFVSAPTSFKLVYDSVHSWKAIEILKTAGEVGTANNTVNALKHAGVQITPVEVLNLGRANGSAYTGWFVLADNHELHWKWRQRPEFERNVDFDAVANKYRVTMRGVPFHKDWRGTAGHPPS